MDIFDSSLTRVQPVFNELLDRWPDGTPWFANLWDLAAETRQGVAAPRPEVVGTLLASETPLERGARVGKVFERTVAPPVDFLHWLLEHPERMEVRDPINFGATSETSRAWRRKLFSTDPLLVSEARDEAQRQLAKRSAQRGRQKWWAFEGFSRVDCCLITDQCVLFVEENRTESVSPSTLWFKQRSQLWRNVEAAQEFAGGKDFGVIVAVETEAGGNRALQDAAQSLIPSLPHLTPEQQAFLNSHLLGFATWSILVERLGLPSTCLPHSTGQAT